MNSNLRIPTKRLRTFSPAQSQSVYAERFQGKSIRGHIYLPTRSIVSLLHSSTPSLKPTQLLLMLCFTKRIYLDIGQPSFACSQTPFASFSLRRASNEQVEWLHIGVAGLWGSGRSENPTRVWLMMLFLFLLLISNKPTSSTSSSSSSSSAPPPTSHSGQ